ncbi:hypothetical protein WJX74_010114 [Apatococcus lobatus]|uniref:Uncharacterized protein n=1 Tax=Apatococcus lobatus TaxID=904363 RepID=A0AAW1R0I9_9CHLO
MDLETDTITQAVRAMRAPAAQPPPVSEMIAPAPDAPAPAPQNPSPPASLPAVPEPPTPQSSTSASSSIGDDTASTLSGSQDARPLRRRITPTPEPRTIPPRRMSPDPPQEWALRKWLPLLAAAATFATVFSAGPILLPYTFLNEDGRPDKRQWAMAAGAGASLALALVYFMRFLMR